MKKYLAVLLLLVAPITAWAGTVKYNGYLANEAGLTYTKAYPLPMNQVQADNVSFQLTWSTANPLAVPFTDGSVATGKITVSSSPAQGISGETVCISNICFSDGNQWTHDPLGFSSGTALSITNAINASPLNTVLVASVPANGTVIFTTSTIVGTAANFALFSSSNSALGLTTLISSTTAGVATGTMSGGTNSAYTLVGGSATILSSTNTFGSQTQTGMVGFEVLYTTTSGNTALIPLINATTYYVIPVSPAAFGLATTSANAQAGKFIVFTSSTAKTTADGFLLTPEAYSGNASGLWQVSNDGVNWAGVTTSSQTFTPVFPSSTTAVDFGLMDYSWIRFNVAVPPTQGGLQLQIIPNAKNSGL